MKCKCGNPAKVGEPLNQCWCCYLSLRKKSDVPKDEKIELSLKLRELKGTNNE